jgi:hypothetical protein
MAPPTKGVIHLTPEVNEQCFLLEKAAEIYKHKKTEPLKPCRQLGQGSLGGYSTNFKYIKEITFKDTTGVRNFFEVRPSEAAQMIHFAQVSETFYNKQGKVKNRKSIFPSNNSTDFGTDGSILQSTGQRRGAGIQSINITQEGIDSATKNIVLVNATFMFQDMRTLTEKPFRNLLNLGTYAGTGKSKTFRYIEFDLGWSTNDALASKRFGGDLTAFDLKLKTHLVKYTFDLKEDASVIVNAQYRGHIVDMLNGPATNILALAKDSFDIVKGKKSDIYAEGLKTNSNARSTTVTLLRQQEIAIAKAKWVTGLTSAQIGSYLPSANVHGNDWKTSNRWKLVISKDMTTPTQKTKAEAQIDKFLMDVENWRNEPADKRTPGMEQHWIDQMKKAPHLFTEQIAESKKSAAGALAHTEAEFLKAAYLAKFIALRTLIEKISTSGKIHYAYLTKDEVVQIKESLPNPDVSGLQNALAHITPAKFMVKPAITKNDLSKGTHQTIPFMYLGDLMSVVLNLPVSSKNPTKTVYEQIKEESGQKILTDFGYMSYYAPYSNTYNKNFDLYYLPISVKKLNNFFANEIIGKERAFYSYDAFLKTVLKTFITGFFKICKDESANKAATLASPKIDFVVGDKNSGYVNYFIYGLKNTKEDIRKGKIEHGSYNANLNNKIYHFYLGGQRRGIVKSVKVTDVADQITKTAIYYDPSRASAGGNQSESDDAGLGGWMPVVFAADVTTMGFPLYSIGQLVYIDLKPFLTNRTNRQFKANGYYAIHKVEHKFSVEGFESTFKAIIQYSDFDKGLKDGDSSGKPLGPAAPTMSQQFKADAGGKTSAEKQAELSEANKEYLQGDAYKIARENTMALIRCTKDLPAAKKTMDIAASTLKNASSSGKPAAQENYDDATKAHEAAKKACEAQKIEKKLLLEKEAKEKNAKEKAIAEKKATAAAEKAAEKNPPAVKNSVVLGKAVGHEATGDKYLAKAKKFTASSTFATKKEYEKAQLAAQSAVNKARKFYKKSINAWKDTASSVSKIKRVEKKYKEAVAQAIIISTVPPPSSK